MKRFKVDTYFDVECRKYALTEFKDGSTITDIKPSRSWFKNFKVEEDIYHEKPVIFKATLFRRWEDGYGCDHTETIRTIYVLAHSYFDATNQLKVKVDNYCKVIEGVELSQVHKDDRDAIDILLSI